MCIYMCLVLHRSLYTHDNLFGQYMAQLSVFTVAHIFLLYEEA